MYINVHSDFNFILTVCVFEEILILMYVPVTYVYVHFDERSTPILVKFV
jgi:hypothetical protein